MTRKQAFMTVVIAAFALAASRPAATQSSTGAFPYVGSASPATPD